MRVFERRVRSRSRALFLAVCLAAAGPAFSTTVLAPRFEALVDHAELIFTGHVIAQRSEWRNQNGQKSIVTLVTFGVQQIHKGRAGNTVTLQFLGGTIGDVTLQVAEMPRFNSGERVVLFVAENGLAASPVLGFFHGRFSLRRGADGREEVLQHSGVPVVTVSDIGRTREKSRPVTESALSHDQFTEKIRERAARKLP